MLVGTSTNHQYGGPPWRSRVWPYVSPFGPTTVSVAVERDLGDRHGAQRSAGRRPLGAGEDRDSIERSG